jgi:hypothetical protein
MRDSVPDQLQWGDQITYAEATGWHHDGRQPKDQGPYTGGIVGCGRGQPGFHHSSESRWLDG